VDLNDPEQPLAELVASYTHTVDLDVECEHGAFVRSPDYTDLQQRCYWDYFRIFVPGGVAPISGQAPSVPAAWLLSSEAQSGVIEVAHGEHGTTIFSGLFVLPTDETGQVQVAYALPPTVLSEQDGILTYTLDLFKQPGTLGTPIRIVIGPPEGYRIIEQTGLEQNVQGNLILEIRLYVDQTFRIQFQSSAEGE
jgi:hypothetical protein